MVALDSRACEDVCHAFLVASSHSGCHADERGFLPRPGGPVSHESKALLRASKRYARENRWLSWWHLGSALVLFAALLVAACLHALPWPVRVLTSVIAGMMIVRLFIVYHDYQHGTILKGSPLAAGLMTAYGLVTLNPPSIWNRSHNYHHKNNAKM